MAKYVKSRVRWMKHNIERHALGEDPLSIQFVNNEADWYRKPNPVFHVAPASTQIWYGELPPLIRFTRKRMLERDLQDALPIEIVSLWRLRSYPWAWKRWRLASTCRICFAKKPRSGVHGTDRMNSYLRHPLAELLVSGANHEPCDAMKLTAWFKPFFKVPNFSPRTASQSKAMKSIPSRLDLQVSSDVQARRVSGAGRVAKSDASMTNVWHPYIW